MDQTKEWLIRVEEELEMALDEGDYMQCNAIISEVHSQGYEDLAKKMIEKVEQTPILTFANTASPYGMA
jgi:hypothetical protein